jgi:hypothetical protein
MSLSLETILKTLLPILLINSARVDCALDSAFGIDEFLILPKRIRINTSARSSVTVEPPTLS